MYQAVLGMLNELPSPSFSPVEGPAQAIHFVLVDEHRPSKRSRIFLPITRTSACGINDNCRIPDDCIDPKRYPLFMARAVLQELIESLQSTQEVKPC